MKPKTPLPWDHVPSQGTFRMLPEDWEFAVHAANSHEKYKTIIAEFIEYASDMKLDNDLMRRAREAVK